MPVDPSRLSRAAHVSYYVSNLGLRALLGAARLLPYRWRVPAMGWLAAYVAAPLAGMRRRVCDNLHLVRPDLDEAEVARLSRAVADNAGRMIIEVFSGDVFIRRARTAEIEGPGLAALEEARAAGRPAILVTGHFGNYDAARSALIARGFAMGGLYRRIANPYFNADYVRALARIGTPLFEQGRRGMMEMVRHLRGGGIIAIVSDLHVHGGADLTFFGHPAVTSTVPQELALKCDAVMIPVYSVRQPNGLDFRIEMHAPIVHDTPEAMAQAVNDDLEAMVRRHMDQWFWIHRRWKPYVPPPPATPAS
jgi:KDO2-lipid IV(A) lauroyltransferase